MKLLRLSLVLTLMTALASGVSAQQYTWSNFAGQPGGRGNTDGTGTDAHLNFPYSVVVDSSGNAFVADSLNHTIRKVTPIGVVTTLAGAPSLPGSADGTGSAARFNGLQGLAIDGADNLYVADTLNYTVRKVTPAGVVSTLAGTAGVADFADGTGTAARFRAVRGIGVDTSGNVFVSDSDNYIIRKITPAGVVSTLAGSPGFSGTVNGTGSAARFRLPRGMAISPTGDIYLADASANAIRKITPAGVVTTIAGAGLAGSNDGNGTSARFRLPRAVAIDPTGNIFVTDSSNNTIRRVAPNGDVTTLAGTPATRGSADGTGSAARFFVPSGVTVTASGDLLVGDGGNSLIRRVTMAGVTTTFVGSPERTGADNGTGAATRFSGPVGLAVDSTGIVYVGDYNNNLVRKITPAAEVTILAVDRTDLLINPAGVTLDRTGNLLLANYFGPNILRVTPSGLASVLAGSGFVDNQDGPASSASFSAPYAITTDASGNTYVADPVGHVVRQITPDGYVTTIAGYSNTPGEVGYIDPGTGLPLSHILLNNPSGVAVDASGNVYIADTNNQVIKKRTPNGVFSTFAGQIGVRGSADGTGTAAQFNGPYGMSFDSAGNLFVADFYNSTIRKITPAGVVTTVGGTAGQATTADGVGAAARFAFPIAVAVAPNRTLYVTDTNNRVVRGVPEAVASSQLINVSTRLRTGTGDDVLIAGFVVQGSGEKKVVVRALGPSLSGVGVSGTLGDPTLAVFNAAGAVVGANDNCIQLSGADQTTLYGFGLMPTRGEESALVLSLPPGSYTAIVRGAANSTGNCLVEVYDADLPAAAKLINLSTRGPVGTGDSVMIAGFVVNGNAPKRVLVRALGPSLSAAGVPNLLADPTLELFSATASLATNDDWAASQQAEISATGVAPTNAKESAIVATLPPGTYTAIVRGAGGSTGNALVEVYELP